MAAVFFSNRFFFWGGGVHIYSIQKEKYQNFFLFLGFLQDVTENRSRYQTTTSFTSGAIRY